jgi:hypothetical protein
LHEDVSRLLGSPRPQERAAERDADQASVLAPTEPLCLPEAGSSGEPQAPQNRAVGAFAVAQTGQPCASDAPQVVENRCSASFVAEHAGQVSVPLTSAECRRLRSAGRRG